MIREGEIEALREILAENKDSEIRIARSFLEDIVDYFGKQSKIGEWIPCSERMPENEQEVEITYVRSGRTSTGKNLYLTARAFHEDGTMEKEDSDYIWDLDYACDSLEYDAENDCYIVAEGWYESVSFADEFNRIVDETVIAWRPIMEPYQAGNY